MKNNSNLLITAFLFSGLIFSLPMYFANAEERNGDDLSVMAISVNEDNDSKNENRENERERNMNESEDEDRNDDNATGAMERERERNMNATNTNGDLEDDDKATTSTTTESKGEKSKGEEHRSVVATFVKKVLTVADREPGDVGEQIKVVAKEQNDDKDDISDKIVKVENRSKFKTFLIGTDYKNVGELRSNLVKTENHIDRLNRTLDKTTDATNRAELEKQIKTLQDEHKKIDTFLKENETKFSLLGWLVKLFQ